MASSPRATAAWRAFAARTAARRSPEEMRYTAYVVLLTSAVVAVPVAGAARTWLLTSGLLDAPVSTAAAVVAVGCGSLALLVALGAVRGPVVGEPFVLATLSDTELPGRHTFRRPWTVTLVAVLVSVLVLASVVASAVAPAWGVAQAAAVLLGAAGTAAAATVAWLVGQVMRQGRTWPVVLALAVPAVVGASQVSAGAAVRVSSTSALTLAAVVGGIGLVLLACAPALLDRLPTGRVLAQSRAWASARVRASSGDLSGAVGTFRAVPTVGRCLRATGSHGFVPAIVRADAVGALRTPVRCATGVVALVAAGWAAAVATTESTRPGWTLAAVAAVLAFTGAGVFCNGLRHAVSALAAPRLYGGADATLVAAHAVAPGLAALVAMSSGALLRGATDGLPATGTSLVVVAILAVGAVVLRVYDAAKGHPPMWIYSPVPTPTGDLSAVTVVLWQSDAVLLTVALAVLAVGGATVWQPFAAAVMVAVIAGTALILFARRLDRL